MLDKELKLAKEKTTCALCGDDLKGAESAFETVCDYCGKVDSIEAECESGHYICHTCLSISPVNYVKKICKEYRDNDPIALAVKIMNSPVIRMHGPEHHFIVPAVLLTALHNEGATGIADLGALLNEAEERAEKESPMNCVYSKGLCGAGIGAGIFLNIFSGIDSVIENKAASFELIEKSLDTMMQYEGSRCCKRDTYLAIQTTAEFLKSEMGIDLPVSEAKCTFSMRNKSCKHEDCNFYNLSLSLG